LWLFMNYHPPTFARPTPLFRPFYNACHIGPGALVRCSYPIVAPQQHACVLWRNAGLLSLFLMFFRFTSISGLMRLDVDRADSLFLSWGIVAFFSSPTTVTVAVSRAAVLGFGPIPSESPGFDSLPSPPTPLT